MHSRCPSPSLIHDVLPCFLSLSLWSTPSNICSRVLCPSQLKPSSPTSTSVPLPVPMSGSPAGSHESLPSNASTTSDPRSPITPAIPANNLPPPPPIASRKIKFAPLPDPRTFQRSLSTGRNIKFAATLGPGGERSTQLQEQGVGRQGEADDSALTDDDDDDDDGDGQEDRVRRSSLLGSSWGKSTKKILTLGLSSSSSSGSKNLARTSSLESNVGSDISRSLSNLTRSLTPSSPALNGSSRDKKRRPSSTSVDLSATQQKLLASLSPTTPTTSRDRSSSPSGREGGSKRYSASSLDPADASMLSTSPRSPVGIKLLNGKVYGGRGREAIEKAEQEALKGEDFREWTSSGGMGSVSRSGGPDEDDGSGEFLLSSHLKSTGWHLKWQAPYDFACTLCLWHPKSLYAPFHFLLLSHHL